MTVLNLRRLVVISSLTVLTVFLTLSLGCMSLSGGIDEESPAMTLSAGEDYVGDRGSPGGTPMMAMDIDAEYKTESRGRMDTSSNAAWATPGEPGFDPAPAGAMHFGDIGESASDDTGGNNVISRALASAGIDEARLDEWIFPRAYAEDHGTDEQYLVRTGNVHMEVKSYEDAQQDIGAIAGKYGGFVSNSQSQRFSDERVEGWVMIRVPAEQFFTAWEEIRALGDITEENIATEDVSQQFLSNHSKIKNLMAQQATLQEMLGEAIEIQRKHGLGEGHSLLMQVQKELFDVTSQLQAVEDRQNALSDRISKSTITAYLTEVKEVQEVIEQVKEDWDWGTSKAFDDAFKTLLNTLRRLWHNIIWFVFTGWTWLVPLAFWIAVAIFVYRKWVRPFFVKSAQEEKERREKTKARRDALKGKDKPEGEKPE